MMARATAMGLDVECHVMEFDWPVQALVEETLVRGGQLNQSLDGSLAFCPAVLQN